jgi:molecular chaperone GrpE
MNEEHKKKKAPEALDNDNKKVYDDVTFDADMEAEGGEFDARDTIKKLREKLRACGEEKQQYLLGWQRTKADFVNMKKAEEEYRKDFLKFANQGLIEELLPVVESFQMAFSNKEAWEKVDKNWRTGVEYIYGKLMSALEQHGLKEINPVGEKFDPARHDSFENVPTNKKEEDHIITAVVQKGYELHGRVIRPPKVVVAVLDESGKRGSEQK